MTTEDAPEVISRIDPKVDFAFKWLFGRERNLPLLAHLINSVLTPPAGEEIVELQLLDPFNLKDSLDDKLSILDVKARDKSGQQFGIEMQMINLPWFTNRILYYWARLHEQQLKKGDDYDKAHPTISICITDFKLFPQAEDYCMVFELCNKKHDLVFSSDIRVITLELTKFRLRPEQISSPLERWVYFLSKGEELDDKNLPSAMDSPEIHHALEELNMLSQDEAERRRYDERVRVLRDERSLRNWAENAEARGVQKGKLEVLESLINERFGSLSERARMRLKEMKAEKLLELGCALLKAESMKDLGLDD